MSRLLFLPGEQSAFINSVYSKSRLSSKELANLAGVHSRSLSDWRREKLRMTLSAAEVFCRKFDLSLPEDKDVMIQRWRIAQRGANKIGGDARFKKYGIFATVEGRSKGGKRSLSNLREKGIIPYFKSYQFPNDFSVDLAEYVGILLGDGGITPEQCFIALNSEADADYVVFMINFCQQIFGEAPKIYKNKNDKGIVIYYSGVMLVKYLMSLGLKIGNKVRLQVDVPEWIKVNKDFSKACLRGLMDTDGGVFLHRYKVKGKTYSYRKISFSNRSLPLLNFVRKTLKVFGFTPKQIDKVENKQVWLYNDAEVTRYLEIVGTHNQRLLKHHRTMEGC